MYCPHDIVYVGPSTELVTHLCHCSFSFIPQLASLRLSFSGCIFGRSSRFHRLRNEILHRSIKKNYQKILIRQKVRATQSREFEIFWDRKFSKKNKIFIENSMKMKIFEIKKFRNFSISKFSLKIVWKSKNRKSKI